MISRDNIHRHQFSASNMLQAVDNLTAKVHNIHGMLTRGEEGISKKKWFLSIVHLFSHPSDGNPNDSEPLCSKATLIVPAWKSAMPYEYNVLIQQTNWASVIPLPLDKSLVFRLLLMDYSTTSLCCPTFIFLQLFSSTFMSVAAA